MYLTSCIYKLYAYIRATCARICIPIDKPSKQTKRFGVYSAEIMHTSLKSQKTPSTTNERALNAKQILPLTSASQSFNYSRTISSPCRAIQQLEVIAIIDETKFGLVLLRLPLQHAGDELSGIAYRPAKITSQLHPSPQPLHLASI